MNPVHHVSDNYPEPVRSKLIDLVNEMADANQHLEETAAKVIQGFLKSGVELPQEFRYEVLGLFLNPASRACPQNLKTLFKQWDETAEKQYWDKELNNPHTLGNGIRVLDLARKAGGEPSLAGWDTEKLTALADVCAKTLEICELNPWYLVTVNSNINATLTKDSAETYLQWARKELKKRSETK